MVEQRKTDDTWYKRAMLVLTDCDYYRVLGVGRRATGDDIHEAVAKLASSKDSLSRVEQNAATVLQSPSLREQYDVAHDIADPPPPELSADMQEFCETYPSARKIATLPDDWCGIRVGKVKDIVATIASTTGRRRAEAVRKLGGFVANASVADTVLDLLREMAAVASSPLGKTASIVLGNVVDRRT